MEYYGIVKKKGGVKLVKKIKRISIFLLVGILLFSFLFPACDVGKQSSDSLESSGESTDSHQPYQPIYDQFYDNIVSVGIKPKYSEVNKIWYEEDFQLEGIGIEKIVDLTYRTDPTGYVSPSFSQLLVLTLSEPSKENVIAAIHQIEVLYFVNWAEPRYIYDSEDDYTPNDEQYASQWSLNSLHDIPIENAWDLNR